MSTFAPQDQVMSFGQRLRAALDMSGIPHGEFARRIGMNNTHLSHLLSGRRGPQFETLTAIVEALPHIDARYLLTGKRQGRCNEPVSSP